MKIQALKPSFRGRTLTVGGTDYTVGEDLTLDLPDDDAARLLAGPSWVSSAEYAAKQKAKHAASKKKSGIMLKGSIPDALKEPVAAPEPDPTPAPVEPEVPAEEPALDADAPVGEDGEPLEEWPDPSEDMSEDYLRTLADAYDVDHSKVKTKKTLVKKINAVMFD